MKKATIIFLTLTILTTFTRSVAKAQTNEASPSDEIRKKVQEKIIKISQKPKAFIGTITDIAESTIQISRFALNESGQEKNGEILQITFNKDTVFIDNREKPKNIKSQDLAIGDFIIAMGINKNNNILESSRILSIKPITPTKRESFKLVIKDIKKQEITAESKNGEAYTIKVNKDTKIINQENKDVDLADIKKEDEIILSGEISEKIITARTIFYLK
jgi:hypothetical protein